MNDVTLIKLYEMMLIIREAEESLIEPINKKEIRCPVHLCSGQEAVAVGLLSQLDQHDTVFGNHRSHGHYLAKGGDLDRMIAEVFCRESGCSRGRGGSMHLYQNDVGFLGSAPIVAGTVSLALGAAIAAKLRNKCGLAVTFFGDGATNEGVIYECLNFAALKKLPIIFACENNLYATHMPIRACRPNNQVCTIADPFDIPYQQIDGNDIIAVHEAAAVAIDHCRRGEGPYFLEFLTYRLRGHVGPDDIIQGQRTDIRPAEELAGWRARDPISLLRTKLIDAGVLTKEKDALLINSIQERVASAHQFARSSDFPKEEDMAHYVFA